MTCMAATSSLTVGAAEARRPTLPRRAMTVFGIAAAITFSASSGASTPLYRLYQEGLGLSPFMITVIFAVYALSLLAALLTVGSLSDYIGRRPVVFAALALNVAAMVLFADAHSAAMLVAARAIQGFATGAATTALGAAILDTSKTHGPLFNSVTAFLGLTVGTLSSGALVAFAPNPTELVYLVFLIVSGIEIAALWYMPETTTGKPGAWASLRPRPSVPPQVRRALFQVMPVNIAAWALGGFYLSLMPSLVSVATGIRSPFTGGLTVASLMLAGAVAVVTMRGRAVSETLAVGTVALATGVAITLAGVRFADVGLLWLGTVVAGFGFGAAFSGNLRTILPLALPHERAGLLATFYIVSYLAFAVPAILAGLAVPALGLPLSASIYGSVVILLALASLIAMHAARERPGKAGA
jgi:MFS family permease